VLSVRYQPLDADWDGLMIRLCELNFRAAICGPEGAGKTTLLEDLGRRLNSAGQSTRWLQLRRETQSTARRQLDEYLAAVAGDELLLVDGVEQLGPLDWRRLKRRSRRQAGLIITTHAAGRLPTLIECRTTVTLLVSIVEQLAPGSGEGLRDELPELFVRHAGNIRLCLRELYDRCAAIERS